MSTLKKGFMFLGTLILFLCSFLFAPTFLNGNLYIKQFGVDLYIGLISMFWCAVWLKKDRFKINLTIIDLAIILLLIFYAGFILIFKNSLVEHSLPFYCGMFYFISSFLIRTFPDRDLIKLKYDFLICVPMVIILHVIIVTLQQNSIFPSLHGYFNNGSTFGNPDMLGSYIAVLLPFCFIQKKGRKEIGYFAFVIGIILLVFIQARSALLATVLCGVLWLIINERVSKKQLLIVVSLSVLLLMLLIIWHPESVYGRFFIWIVSIKMIIAKPLGWGIFAFEKYYPEFQASCLFSNHDLLDFITPDVVHSPFNEFLNTGVTLGVIGLLLFVILVVFVFYNALKSRDSLIYPLFIFSIISLFYFPFKIVPLIALIIPLVAFVSKESKVVYQKRLSQMAVRSSFFFLILFSLFLTSVSILNYKNQKLWQKAVLISKDGENLKKSEKLFIGLYPFMKENGRFLVTYSNLKYKQGFPTEALLLLEEAENYFCDISLSIKLAKLYEELNLYKLAKKKFELAINIAPNNFIAPYEKILFLQNIGEYDKSYQESIVLFNKPIRKSIYADPFIIKSKLKKIINEYELHRKPNNVDNNVIK